MRSPPWPDDDQHRARPSGRSGKSPPNLSLHTRPGKVRLQYDDAGRVVSSAVRAWRACQLGPSDVHAHEFRHPEVALGLHRSRLHLVDHGQPGQLPLAPDDGSQPGMNSSNLDVATVKIISSSPAMAVMWSPLQGTATWYVPSLMAGTTP